MPTAPTIVDPAQADTRTADAFTDGYRDLLTGSYDCVDRIVLTAYNGLCYSPGGFRFWWRRLTGDEDELDDAHLMRMAGRFARRVRGWAKESGVPVIDCARGERKHRIAEEYLSTHGPKPGVFLILVARAPASVWDVRRSAKGVIYELTKKQAFVNHYSFHIWDETVGHLTIKMSGHPPFGAQVMLNGHELVARAAQAAGISFRKEGNCFTETADPAALAQVADTLAAPAAAGRLREVAERWIYSACLIFGLDLAEQERSGFRYDYSVYQVEYSHNLLFQRGDQMEEIFQGLVDRNRGHLDLRQVRTIFGKSRHAVSRNGASRVSSELWQPSYGLTVFKLHFGKLTLKAYTKGERVLRFEAIADNTKELHCGRVLAKFGEIVARLRGILERALAVLRGMERAFVSDATLDELPRPSTVGRTRVGGVDISRPRMRAVLTAVLALAAAPAGFTAGELAAKVKELGGPAMSGYDARRAAYDLKKLRGKALATKLDRSHRYQLIPEGVPTLAALVLLREKVLRPLLAAAANPPSAPIRATPGHKRSFWERVDYGYSRFRRDMERLFRELHIVPPNRQTFVDSALASALWQAPSTAA